MLDYPLPYYFARTVSYFLSYPSILLWIIYEHFCLKQNKWQKALILMLFIIPWNTFIKAIIGIPLMPPLVGFAIPSGHSHVALAFWGFLAYKYRVSKQSLAIIMTLMMFFWSLVHLHYHNWLDVFVAIAFFVLEVLLFERLFNESIYCVLIGLFSLILLYKIIGISYGVSFSVYMLTAVVIAKKLDYKSWMLLSLIWLFSFGHIDFTWNYWFSSIITFLLIKLSDKNFRVQDEISTYN